ncbi:SDR family oxidoreductase [Chitinimonas koreensis]|uniref:SDR family oxidoreductase n=1 Tax=Chitinimonas koreensis TaxID=356302 RepID=UPI0003FA3D77|nr:SDR family oxidoreductase [Chitinimonas koreensis]QNM98801.1 SDR family oxidoreductase [Chitinimonas koreensis]
MTQRLAGKTVLVTAAGQGIGRASALAMAAEGALVWATDRDEGLLADLHGRPGLCAARLDVTDPAAIEALVARIGTVDVLFNCAGHVHTGTVLEVGADDWAFSWELNVASMYRLARAVLPGMLAAGRGSIVNMSSMASSIKGFPNRCAYGTTKAAVIGLTKSIAADFVKQGIRCNAVCPGTVDTPSLRGRIAAAADPVQAEKDFVARQPMGRLASVNDIAPLVLFLASDESAFVTGCAYSVDGGVTI